MKKLFPLSLHKLFLTLTLLSAFTLTNAREIKTYKGDFKHLSWNGIYAMDPVATYEYYEAEDFSRVYHGRFSVKFHGAGSRENAPRWGKIEGNFKDGYYDGPWTMVVPAYTSHYNSKTKRSTYTYYTVTLKCNFENGQLEGPMRVVMTNSAGKEIIKAIMNYKKGELDGDISYLSYLPLRGSGTDEMTGQYKNGKRVGKWKFNVGESPGYADFDTGKIYIIDSKSGERINVEGRDLEAERLRFPGNTIFNFLLTLKEVTNEHEKYNKPIKEYKENAETAGKEEIEFIEVTSPQTPKVYLEVEQPAEFPGGQASMMKWLSQNIRYPEEAVMNNVQGRVIVKFIVLPDGSIYKAEVVRGVDKVLDQEALRLVNKMPRWQPGKFRGEAVASYYNLPITFILPG